MDYIIKQHELIDILATDHFMPGEIQGSDIAQYITQHLSHIPCLIMSGDINDTKLKI